MSIIRTPESVRSVRARLETVIALARLLERVESDPVAVGADQYRTLVRQVQVALDVDLPDDALRAVLGTYPAAATVYENLHYEHAGLSRASLERSVQSEMATSQLLHRIGRDARNA